MSRRIAAWLWLWLGLSALAPRPGLAEDGARADELFTRGRERLASGDYAAACPLLEQSYALDPATGSLLALALCQEGAGKPSAALRAYREVLTRAEAEQRPDRARTARAKVEALQKVTSSLRVDAAAVAQLPALKLSLDGEPLPLTAFSQPLTHDPGPVCVEASAPDRSPWRECMELTAGSEHTLTIPMLEPKPAPTITPPPAKARALGVTPTASARPVRTDASASLRAPAEWAGIALLSLGGAAFVTSIGFVLRADHQGDLVDVYCNETCSAEADEARAAEQRARDGALVSGMVGLGAAVAGVVTYVWGRTMRNTRARRTAAAPLLSPALAGVSVAGTF